MSMSQLQSELLKLLQMGKSNQEGVNKRLDELYRKFGSLHIEQWRHKTSTNKNSFLHELVEREMFDVIRHIVLQHKFDLEVRRDNDNLTPLQLAEQNQNTEMCELLKELGAKDVQVEDVSKWSPAEDRERSLNIIWLDLEMTSIEDPKILECAVIITDKDLNELEKANWVIHFEQSELDKLGDWHQETFADRENGGNNLFADVVKSKLTNDEVEEKLLALIKRHCPPKLCSLAGSSIHTDKDVLKRCMPKVHDYLHYRIIDVTSFQQVMRRWAPRLELQIKREVAANGQETVNHRAMDDIKWSIAFMKQFRKFLTNLNEVNQQHRGGSNRHASSASNQHHHHQHHQSPSNHHRHQSPSNHHNQGASGHQFKRSISEAQAVAFKKLPKLNPDVEKMELYGDEKRLVERIKFEMTFDVKSLRLNDTWQRVYDANPHLREVLINKERIETYEGDFTRDNRCLTKRIPLSSSKINTSPKKCSTTEHWGQRKLLLTEIEFLTDYGSDNKYLVVYAGAAPGSHLNYLGSLFPNLEFVLIDDKAFTAQPKGNVRIRPEEFTKDIAKHYGDGNRKILFICNVRTYRAQAASQNDGTEDMENQLDWYKLIKPYAALLNFRLPREPGKTQYLKGYQIIEPWASRRATECRLVVKKDAKMIAYDHEEFDENLLFFHYGARVMYYKHDIDDAANEGLDHCYDCRAEIFILQEYLLQVQHVKKDANLKISIAKMSLAVSKGIEDEDRPKFIDAQRTLAVIPKY